MKKLIMLILLWTAFTGNLCLAQKVITKTFTYQNGQKINLHLKFGQKIKVHAWNQNKVEIKSSVKINNGKLNNAFQFKSGQNTGSIWVSTDLDKQKLKEANCADCTSQNHHFSTFDGTRVCMDISYEVWAPPKANISLKTISADITIRGMRGPVHAKTISGFVDMNWPDNEGAQLAMKSISGELYSNLPIQFQNRHKTIAPVGYTLRGTLKNGGPDVHLESISGNIYLRKE